MKEVMRASCEQQEPNSGKVRVSEFSKLVEAAKWKDVETIERLLAKRPELVSRRDKHQRSLLHYAAVLMDASDQQTGREAQKLLELSSVKCFNLLSSRCDLKLWWAQDLDGLSCLHLAVISANLTLVRHLIFEHPHAQKYSLVQVLDNELHSPLHWAVMANQLNCVKSLIEFGGIRLAHEADLNGATPLHYATQTSSYLQQRKRLRQMLARSCHNQSPPIVSNMVEAGSIDETSEFSSETLPDSARPEYPSKKVQRPGRIAPASSKQLEILEFFLNQEGIELESRDNDKRTPLLWAASSGNLSALQLLANSGAKLNQLDSSNLGALHCAASHGFTECLELLLERSAISQLPVDQLDSLQCTPLFYAVISGHLDCIELLLDRGAQINWQDARGRSAGHFGALKGQLSALKLLESRGGNLWLANKQGDLPLHYAIKTGRKQVICWLLKQSPYERAVNAINNFGRSPIHLAIARDNLELTRYLIESGANLNQLVRVRERHRMADDSITGSSGSDRSSKFRYETALDLAERLGRRDCVHLLRQHAALTASQVIARRLSNSKSDAEQLFDCKPAVEQTAPIGLLDSSSSSVSPASAKFRTSREVNSATGSERKGARRAHSSPQPIKGGISYQNERIQASIKCRLYDRRSPSAEAAYFTRDSHVKQADSIVTNVNVYTNSPCPQCTSRSEIFKQADKSDSSEFEEDHTTEPSPVSNEPESEAEIPRESSSNLQQDLKRESLLPELVSYADEKIQLSKDHAEREAASKVQVRHLPPSQNHEQTLPPIQSASELERDAGSSESSSSSDSSSMSSSSSSSNSIFEREKLIDDCKKAEEEPSGRSAADLEPRFDRAPLRHEARLDEQLRRKVSSPVAEYIHQLPSAQFSPSKGPILESKSVDLRHVQPKVDSHWQQQHHDSNNSVESSRTCSRQTLIKRPIGIQNSAEVGRMHPTSGETELLATRVEKSVRKFWKESKLFEELQNLKRNQIRSGRANEALMVKRLVERFQIQIHDTQLAGLKAYRGPYNFESYERYLYEQLYNLSFSKAPEPKFGTAVDSKPAGVEQLAMQHQPVDHQEEHDEDLRAELELRRVLAGSGCLDQVEDQGEQPSFNQLADAEKSSHFDAQSFIPDRQEGAEVEDRANRLADVIMVDALGNLANVKQEVESSSPLRPEPPEVDNLAARGRRRSVIRIGNKMDVVYHDVGIEINPVEEATGLELEETDHEIEAVKEVEPEARPKEGDGDEKSRCNEGSQEEIRSSWQRKQISLDEEKLNKRSRAFTGYDLDAMQMRRRKSRQRRRSSGDLDSLDSTASELLSSPRVGKMKCKRRFRKPRSHIPRKWRVRIPIEEVRARWRPIKALGRRQLKQLASSNEFHLHWTRSQPNLGPKSSNIASDEELEEQFELIYELNKPSKLAEQITPEMAKSRAFNQMKSVSTIKQRESEFCCQRRIVRIVDIRNVRRRMSLPETFIYSNDLMRRFNVLKL